MRTLNSAGTGSEHNRHTGAKTLHVPDFSSTGGQVPRIPHEHYGCIAPYRTVVRSDTTVPSVMFMCTMYLKPSSTFVAVVHVNHPLSLLQKKRSLIPRAYVQSNVCVCAPAPTSVSTPTPACAERE